MKANKIEYPLSFKVFSITLLLLILGGMLILFSASSRVAFDIDGNANSFFESHIKYLVLSILIGFVFYLFDYKSLKKLSWFFILITFSLVFYRRKKYFSIGGNCKIYADHICFGLYSQSQRYSWTIQTRLNARDDRFTYPDRPDRSDSGFFICFLTFYYCSHTSFYLRGITWPTWTRITCNDYCRRGLCLVFTIPAREDHLLFQSGRYQQWELPDPPIPDLFIRGWFFRPRLWEQYGKKPFLTGSSYGFYFFDRGRGTGIYYNFPYPYRFRRTFYSYASARQASQ